jgi:hypothetical protein
MKFYEIKESQIINLATVSNIYLEGNTLRVEQQGCRVSQYFSYENSVLAAYMFGELLREGNQGEEKG